VSFVRVDVTALTALLAPFLGMLAKAGTDVADQAAGALSGALLEHAGRLWARLRPAVEGKPAAEEAAKDVAEQPDDEMARNALAWQLKKLLESDPQLLEDMKRLWADAAQAGGVTAGERGVAVGGSMHGSTIVTGDQNVLRGGA
jgi:hypothetical protein